MCISRVHCVAQQCSRAICVPKLIFWFHSIDFRSQYCKMAVSEFLKSLHPFRGALSSQDTLKYIFAIFAQETKRFWYDRLDMEYMVYTDNFFDVRTKNLSSHIQWEHSFVLGHPEIAHCVVNGAPVWLSCRNWLSSTSLSEGTDNVGKWQSLNISDDANAFALGGQLILWYPQD